MNERPAWERHIQTLSGTVIIGLVAWVGLTLSSVDKEMTALKRVTETQIAAIMRSLDEIRSTQKDAEIRIRKLEADR